MRPILIYSCIVFALIMALPAALQSKSIDDLLDQYSRQYQEMIPAPNSSINDDYKMGQTALGVFYTNQILNLIYAQNQEMVAGYNEMLTKYNEVIRQNNEIIKLLGVIAKQGEEG